MAKEAYIWQKRPIYGKRDLLTFAYLVATGGKVREKRPIYGKRGLYMAKETY